MNTENATPDLPPTARLDDEDVWIQSFHDDARFQGRPALFLDRDGAMIEEKHYLSDPAGVVLDPGTAPLVKRCNAANVAVVIVTNQAGIARDYYGWDAFARVQDKLLADLAADGARIDAVFACGHHENGIGDYRHPSHPARKPNPGMMLRAHALLGVDLQASWVIGDRAGDLQAGRNAGLAGGIHVLTGHGGDDGERDQALALATSDFQVLTADTIADAAARLPLFKPE